MIEVIQEIKAYKCEYCGKELSEKDTYNPKHEIERCEKKHTCSHIDIEYTVKVITIESNPIAFYPTHEPTVSYKVVCHCRTCGISIGEYSVARTTIDAKTAWLKEWEKEEEEKNKEYRHYAKYFDKQKNDEKIYDGLRLRSNFERAMGLFKGVYAS